ncbi:MAG: hypothetical protein R3224_10970 [Balneolaceae bacterium]|nr:hypothetical protein [Balneolaceae bacterium]
MKFTTSSIVAIGLSVMVLFAGCGPSLQISNVDYSQPIETVLKPDDTGQIHDVQHGIQFNILPLQYVETQDTSSVMVDEVRLIRGRQGFYYITAPGFRHVYVMSPQKGKLNLVKKLMVSENGLQEPAFNQRNTHIQLLNRSNNETYTITADGIIESDNRGSNEEAG